MRFYKVFSPFIFFCLAIATGSALASPRVLSAQGENDFFEKNVALTVFENEVTQSDIPRLKILREKEPKELKNSPDVELRDAGNLVQAPQRSESEHAVKAEEKSLTKSEDIVKQFGDPNVEAPVLAKDDAPLPFQGMMAALDAGDDKLAFQYAKKYVRYVRNLQNRTKEATIYQKLAMQEEGIISAASNQNDKRLDPYAKLLLEQEKETSSLPGQDILNKSANLSALDPKVKAVLEQAAMAEEQSGDDSSHSKMLAEMQKKNKSEAAIQEVSVPATKEELVERARAVALIKNKAPVDQKGEVDVYFFFRPRDKHSQQMGYDIQKLYKQYKDNPKIRIIGLTMEVEDAPALQAFRFSNQSTFPVQNGAMLAKKLNVKSVPTTIGVARTSGNALVEEGRRSYYYIDELVKQIRGGDRK